MEGGCEEYFLTLRVNWEIYMSDQVKEFENEVEVMSQYMQSPKNPHIDATRRI